MVDTHSHLNFEAFKNDFQSVILRAQENDVKKIIVVGSNLETSEKAVEIAKQNKTVFAAIGLHPIHVKDEAITPEFEKLAENKKVVAIGETGLDYYYDKGNADAQKEVFLTHIRLAKKLSKPIIIHSRDAGEDILSILTSQAGLPKGVFHCFSENLEFSKIILEMGFYLSFTGIITFTKNYEVYEVIKNAPIEKILIETDCPYLTPDPYRGKRNEPMYVLEVAKKIAEIKKIPLEEVSAQTSKNAEELFDI
jgi:TatD DNase family protein